MSNGKVVFDSASRINKIAFERVRKGIGAPGDSLLSHKGTVGRVAWVPMDAPSFVCSPQTTFWRATEGGLLHRRYLTYFLMSRPLQTQLDAYKGETSMADYVSLTSQRRLKVAVPPLPEQRRIAAVLGALDDKIELNRKMNRTLEEMAQALFKSWFIDFDGHDPEDLVDSELGPIPRGWNVGSLGDLLELKRGYDLPKKHRVPGSVPIISSSGPSGWHDTAKAAGPGVVAGRYGTIGRVFYVEGNYWPLNTSLYVRDFKGGPPRWAFHLLERVNWHAYTGKSAVPGVNRNHVHKERVVLPPVGERVRFTETVGPLWARHAANKQESNTLAELRDTLLPKLISGELRVPEALDLIQAAP